MILVLVWVLVTDTWFYCFMLDSSLAKCPCCSGNYKL